MEFLIGKKGEGMLWRVDVPFDEWKLGVRNSKRDNLLATEKILSEIN